MKKHTKKPENTKPSLPKKIVIDPTAFVQHPHDKFLKYLFCFKEVAIEFLRFSLPPETFNQLDPDTFEPENNSFIDKKMKTQYADTVFSIKTKSGKPYRISLIWEFKGDIGTKPVPIQLLGYAHSALEYDFKQKQAFRPPVCIVIYHGVKPIKKTTMIDLFEDAPSDLQTFIPSNDYILVNINEMSDEQILQLNFTFLPNLLLVLKYGRNPVKVFKYFENMFIFADENVDILEEIREITLLYLSVVSQINLENMNTLIEKLPRNKAKILKGTFAHALLEKKAEGKVETKKEILISLMQKFPNLTDAELADLAKVDETFVSNLRQEVKPKK